MSELHSVQLNHSRLSYTWLVVHDCMLSSLLQMHANTSHAADPQLKLTMTLSSMLMYLNINLGTPSKNRIIHAQTLLSCFLRVVVRGKYIRMCSLFQTYTNTKTVLSQPLGLGMCVLMMC